MIDKTPEELVALFKQCGASRESGWLDWHIGNDQLQAFAAALTAAQPVEPAATRPANSQDWAGMDGAAAFHLIERHSDNWADAALMMDEWRLANTAQPAALPAHSLEDDFQHFLAYSGATDVEKRLRMAYEHGNDRGAQLAPLQPASLPEYDVEAAINRIEAAISGDVMFNEFEYKSFITQTRAELLAAAGRKT